MKKHTVKSESTLYQALQQMNQHRVKFLVAVEQEGRVVGTLTDGDIRRAILNGMKLEDSIDGAICKQFTYVENTAGLQQILTAFQDPRVEFLPVLGEDNKLCNIITRRALNVLLLQNKTFQIGFDFNTIDENALEHEIFSRPWGFYKTTVLNDTFQAKIIHIMPGQAMSLQSHQRREEYWVIVSGEGRIQLGDSIHTVGPGGSCFIPKGCKHRLTNTSATETLVLSEVQLGDYFGENDICRYEDQYGRS